VRKFSQEFVDLNSACRIYCICGGQVRLGEILKIPSVKERNLNALGSANVKLRRG
jgi:hypothetical protein